MARVDGVSRNPGNGAHVLQSLARNRATPQLPGTDGSTVPLALVPGLAGPRPRNGVTHARPAERHTRGGFHPRPERTLLHHAAGAPGSGDHQDRAAPGRQLPPLLDGAGRRQGRLRVPVDQRQQEERGAESQDRTRRPACAGAHRPGGHPGGELPEGHHGAFRVRLRIHQGRSTRVSSTPARAGTANRVPTPTTATPRPPTTA